MKRASLVFLMALLLCQRADAGLTRSYTDEVQNAAADATTGTAANELLSSDLVKIGKHFDYPLRLYATGTDSLLHVGGSITNAGDSGGKVNPPLAGTLVTTFADTTIDFQAASSFVTPSGNVLVDGGAFALPSTTIGQFRQMVLVFRSDGKMDAHFSPAAASLGALEDVGTTFAALPGTSKIGYILLEATAAQKFKTAGSGTSIIQAAVSGSPRIIRLLGGAAKSLTTDVTGILPTLNGGSAVAGTATFPSSGVIVTEAATETLTNKTITLADANFTVQDDGDATKQAKFQLSGISTGTTRTYTLPDASSTLQDLATNQTITGIKSFSTRPKFDTFTNLAAGGTLDLTSVNNDWAFPATTAGTTSVVGDSTIQTLTNKTISTTNTLTAKDTTFSVIDAVDGSKKILFDAAGTASTTTTLLGSQTTNRTLTLPDATDTLVGKNTTDSLTNKSLNNTTTLTIKTSLLTLQDGTDTTKQATFDLSANTTGTTKVYSFPTITDTLAGLAAGQTLTNKTISGTANTLQNLATEDDFSGNGSQTDFTLAEAMTAARFVQVFVDGRLQREGAGNAWTRTNATPGHVVFNTAPENGSWVDVTIVNQ